VDGPTPGLPGAVDAAKMIDAEIIHTAATTRPTYGAATSISEFPSSTRAVSHLETSDGFNCQVFGSQREPEGVTEVERRGPRGLLFR